jgi:hypothetical protein
MRQQRAGSSERSLPPQRLRMLEAAVRGRRRLATIVAAAAQPTTAGPVRVIEQTPSKGGFWGGACLKLILVWLVRWKVALGV